MNLKRLLNYLQLAHFSRPKGDRAVFRAVAKHQPQRIVEIGLGMGERAQRLIPFCALYQSQPLHYTAIDLFEARGDGARGLSYKQAHQLLAGVKAKVQLIPGDPYSALARWANSLTDIDLLIVSAGQDPAAMEQTWFYVPRMLRPNSLVLESVLDKKNGEEHFRAVSQAEIEKRASRRQNLKSAA